MPPKRKTRAATAASPISASQPEPQRPTRTSARKRRHSDSSNASEVSSSQVKSGAAVKKTPAKRGRPSKAVADPEMIVEEEEEVMSQDERATPACNGLIESHDAEEQSHDDEGRDSILVSQTSTKRVHFGVDIEDTPTEKSTAAYITPHPRLKMSIKRRRTVSPSEEGSVKRIKNTRTSLPASLAQQGPTQIIQELRFAPLRNILDERIRRLSAMPKTAPSKGEDEVDVADDDILVLDGHDEELSIFQLTTPSSTPIVDGEHGLKPAVAASNGPVTPGAHDRAGWNAERKKFQDAILALQRETEEARARLQILDIELSSIGFAEEDAAALDIVQSIRESFAGVREFLETELPGSLPDNASNQDLIEILIANVKEFADRLRTADKELLERGQLVGDLGGQVNGLLDRLAKKEIENTQLYDHVNQLDGSNGLKDRDLEQLEEDLRTAKEEREDIEKERDEETARANRFEQEKEALEKNIERLSESLKKYHSEEARLTDKINRMEEEHRTTVSAMNKEREETVRDLEDRLDEETALHGEAAKATNEHKNTIKELEQLVATTEAKCDDLRNKLEAATAERDEEQAARQNLEEDLESKNDEVDGLEARVRRLESELDDYKDELDTLRKLSGNEREQRESAEKDLDTRNSAIEELDEKLREQGKLANELRQKLFEVQTKNAEKVKELENAASERDQQSQDDMAVEVRRREGAEELAKARAATVLDLEQQLEDVETRMRDLLRKKDQQLDVLKDELSQRDAEIQNLRDDLHSTENAYEVQAEEHRTRIQDLETNTDALQQTITQHEHTIRNLEQSAAGNARDHGLQIEERDARIAICNDQIAELNVQKDALEKERVRLERKVEHEAENMLELQNETAAEIETLKRTIRDKQNKIQTVEAKYRETDERWQDVLAARNEEIQSLTSTKEKQSKTIDHMQYRFRDYVRRTSGFLARVQEQVDAAKIYADEEGNALQLESNGLLEELQVVEAVGGTKKRAKGKRRVYDSGVGLSVGGLGSSPANAGAEMLSS